MLLKIILHICSLVPSLHPQFFPPAYIVKYVFYYYTCKKKLEAETGNRATYFYKSTSKFAVVLNFLLQM